MAEANAAATRERAGAVTLGENVFTLLGPELKAGDRAPEFTILGNDLKPLTLADSNGKVRIISSVPSLDTPVCDQQTRRFNQEAASLPGVEILTVSMDLPFAQKRWCAAAEVHKVRTASDHRDASFGLAYGTLVKELRLNARAVFVVDKEGVLRHVEYVKEIASHPDYDTALKVARSLAA
jgi:thioredoxin-dependent peroxiredoxin